MVKWLLILLMCSCHDAYKEVTPVHDTVWLQPEKGVVYKAPDNCEALRVTSDSLRTELFLAKFKIEKVRYYVNIVIKNSSQIKYLKGWLIRALK